MGSNALWPLAVGIGLCAWTAVCLVLVRAAERRSGAEPPAPRVSLALCLLLAALAVLTRPTAGAAAAGAAGAGIACITLVVAACADARTGFIFDALTLPAAAAVALLAVVAGAGGEAARGVLLLVGTFGGLVLYSRGRWMGLGDVKAMYALGAAFGPAESLLAILAACVCGIVSVAWQGRLSKGYQLRFGPHLAAGAAFALAAGGPIVHGVLGL